MKYTKINSSLFIKNRSKLVSHLKPGSIALFHSNDEMLKTGDASFKFRQNSDLFYLTGVDQEDSILVVFPDCPNPAFREVLFIKRTNETIAQWDGHKLTPNEAFETSGIKNVFWYDEFWPTIRAIILLAENIYINLNENDRFSDKAPYQSHEFALTLKNKFPGHQFIRSAPIMAKLRTRKEPEEIALLKEAIEITKKAFLRIVGFVKPGVWEYEIEAEMIHEFIRNKSNGHAFDPIIASGSSACVLHYIENNRQCKDGDLLLLDFGADYANYNGDLSRCLPVNGKFSPRQKQVYDAVLTVQRESKKLITPGKLLMDYHNEVGEIMTEQLINIGLLNLNDVKNQNAERPLYKKYFMHGNSHHLGIDVHDIMNRWAPFETGNVLTVEPGIYIPEEGIGVRIENDIILTENGIVDLMAEFPIETQEIENLMNK